MCKIFVYILTLVVLNACGLAAKEGAWVSYNVQNLFDDRNDGTEYNDYLVPDRWNHALYAKKIVNLAQAFDAIANERGRIDLVFLQEAENERTLKSLVEASSALRGMRICFAKKPGQAIGVALLTRYKVIKVHVEDPGSFDDLAVRPLLVVEMESRRGERFVAITGHLPSQIRAANDTLRNDAFAAIASLSRSYIDADPRTPVVIGGDFNRNFSDSGARIGEDRAGFPDIRINKKETSGYALYNPWPDALKAASSVGAGAKGSYFFKETWEAIDHIWFSSAFFNNEGLEFRKFYPFDADFLRVTNTLGRTLGPKRFDSRTAVGYSDHLPIVAVISEKAASPR